MATLNHDEQTHLFYRLLAALRDWYTDQTRARNFEGSGGHGDTGHRVLWSEPDAALEGYLGHWTWLWKRARQPEERLSVLRSLTFELKSRRRLATLAHMLDPETLEWRVAVAHTPGSLREVAEQYKISHESVRSLRQQFGVSFPDAKNGPKSARRDHHAR